jgi:hypothetical protein
MSQLAPCKGGRLRHLQAGSRPKNPNFVALQRHNLARRVLERLVPASIMSEGKEERKLQVQYATLLAHP